MCFSIYQAENVFKSSLKYFLSPCIKHFLIIIASMLALPVSAANNNQDRVFLTFDDGPINVTLDLLDVLKVQGIKATFFINAIHLAGRGGEKEDQSRLALRRIIAEGHVLGNHSYDHMGHNRPAGIYSITASQAYSDIESDINYFVPANIAPVNRALGPLAIRTNNQINLMARLPYANVWVHPLLGEFCHWCGVGKGPFWHPDARANAEQEVSPSGGELATLLFDRYKIISYGWDIQWMPSDWSLATTNETMPSAEVIEEKIIALFNENQNCKDLAPCPRPVRSHNVVVLTHDFLFENGIRGRGKDVNMPQLIKLIELLKAKGYIFDTLDHYLD